MRESRRLLVSPSGVTIKKRSWSQLLTSPSVLSLVFEGFPDSRPSLKIESIDPRPLVRRDIGLLPGIGFFWLVMTTLWMRPPGERGRRGFCMDAEGSAAH
ncbi:unnamed protein product [Vitrella brassicaformis CCMP3155]|uniref:Uncharacterized protein n=1 Tax=Vitrella brassicaformis (strain CCMP3155) TaxID=1169540 RepID=A0A0G4F5L4_VITBC|nr:unnamed protein product [Vitrella brassicaformis CCMP3155]|eukprot:CEM07645.1 unnamed protein product [Vitrella brassicaformis CCMP3155]